MKNSGLFILLILVSFALQAQYTPIPSPGSTVEQTIGISRLEVEYSRPGVKERVIFGELVPFNKVWRTGANAPTQITVSTPVKVNGNLLPTGKYSLLSIPNKDEWTIIFNNDLEITEENYFSINDQLRVFTIPKVNSATETFTIDFSNVKDNKADLNIYWETTLITLEIEVDNKSTIINAINHKSIETAGAFLQASEYLLNNNLDLEIASEYIEKSINLSPSFRNHWVKGRILAEKGKNKEALAQLLIAKNLGENDPVYSLFAETIDKQIEFIETKI